MQVLAAAGACAARAGAPPAHAKADARKRYFHRRVQQLGLLPRADALLAGPRRSSSVVAAVPEPGRRAVLAGTALGGAHIAALNLCPQPIARLGRCPLRA
jgi:hypothetical protein